MSDDLGKELDPHAIDVASAVFEEMTRDRHEMGAQKYGAVKFMEIDSIEMALEEVADLANYARYTFIKLWLLQQQMSNTPAPILGVKSVENPYRNGL